MRKTRFGIWIVFALLCVHDQLYAQAGTAMADSPGIPDSFSQKSVETLTRNYRHLEEKLVQSTDKALRRMQRLESRVKGKLAQKDSVIARQSFTGTPQQISNLLNRLHSPDTARITGTVKEYIPRIDSLQSALRFLQKPTGMSADRLRSMTALTGTLTSLQSRLDAAAAVKQFMKERKQQLKEALEKSGLGKELKQLNKEVYYYQQQLNEYKALLQSPDKLAEKALSLVRDLPAFKDFMQQHSQLAQLFRLPGGGGGAPSLAGLQTRAVVQQQVGTQLGNGINPQQYFQQQAMQAQAELNKLKDKVNQWGGGSSDMEIPDFKPNNQKTKTFWKRLEYGLNIQSQRPNSLLPVTTDIALTIGYKLNDKSAVGIGASYKLGWGKNISNIHFTSEGVGIRSYLDIKFKGSIWISGGYEYNYQQAFNKIEQLRNLDAWQKSGLIGMTKKYKVGKKNGNLQLLWDFLSYSQVPRTQALKFRIGYSF